MATQLAGVAYAAMPTAAKAADALAWPPRLVVIHDTSNDATAQQEALYASTRPLDGATSAHFYVDVNGPLGSVPLNKQAWAAYRYANTYGLHIEMCGYNAGTRGAVPPTTIAHTARLVRQLCELAGIPIVKLGPGDVAAGKRGICGHWDITTGLNVGTHDDPGPLFDWAAFIAAVKEDDVSADEVWSYNAGSRTTVVRAIDRLNQVNAKLDLVLGQLDIDPTELASIQAAAAEGAKSGVLASAADLAAAIVAKLPPTGLTTEDVEAAVRAVFADAGQA